MITPIVGNATVRTDSSHTTVLGGPKGSSVGVSFINQSNATLSDSGMAFEEVGISSRCVGRGGVFVRTSSTTSTTIEQDVPAASNVHDIEKGGDEVKDADTSNDDYMAGESDEMSDSTSKDDLGFEEEGNEDIREQKSNETTSTECESEKGENMFDIDGVVDQHIVLSVGQEFINVNQFRDVLMEYEIQEEIQILKNKNDKNRVTGICNGRGCLWRIHASPNSNGITFVIKTLNPNHICQRLSIKKEGVTAAWIAKKLTSNVKVDSHMNINVMEEYLSEKYGVKANKTKLYRAKCIVNEETDGSHARAYKKLENYGLMVKERNPGTEFVIEYQNANRYGQEQHRALLVNPQFKRLFICFDACKQGFLKGCRPFIGLDGCHLKGVYGGVLVSAIAIDGNNGMFSLAYGVVETECKDSWLFFLHHLLGCIGTVTPAGEPFTFMTDKQKGLIEAIGIKFPVAHHRHCSRHLYNNFKTQFRGGLALRGYFWRASKSYNATGFQRAMNAMKEEKPEAYEWLMKTPKDVRYCHAVYAGADEFEVQDGLNSYVVNLRSKSYDCGVWVATGLPFLHFSDAESEREIETARCVEERGVHIKWPQYSFSYRPSYNVSPTAYMPVVRREDGTSGEGAVLHSMKWGLISSFTKKTEKPDHFKMIFELHLSSIRFKNKIKKP
ncbi:uncharacterized protein LOC122649788 [Telopea speciosissima]|uniref:uncharacterized protein LOC122649788 n=1 Tax=Telopea speciosissima TaxID=54955 RepID=UPI001CC417EF|nr:uncharacterized protein LOC122649788 [Telopea speciosissima]